MDGTGTTASPFHPPPEQPPRKLRILFDLAFPGYLRYFDLAIRELVRRGHLVEVWFDRAGKQTEGLRALNDIPEVFVGGRLPRPEPHIKRLSRLPRSLADYVRYLDPRFSDAPARQRTERTLPRVLKPIRHVHTLPKGVVSRIVKRLLELEDAIPSSSSLEEFFRDRDYDVVVAAPNVYYAWSGQPDRLVSAKVAGIPTVAAIASWDNLVTKGMLRGDPDTVLVWNQAQVHEAAEFHHLPRARVVATGAHPFDKWFDRSPSCSAEAFRHRVGLPQVPYVLFVGSAASVSGPEAERQFVHDWLRAIRVSDNPRVRDIGVLVRPHPYNSEHWQNVDVSAFGAVTIWPRKGSDPLTEAERSDYFDSMFHATAVAGVNTSAMIEAAVVGRPVLTVTLPELNETQSATLHFHHLLRENGGFLLQASSLEEHLTQLGAVLDDPAMMESTIEAFVASFVRPFGVATPASAIFADALEAAHRAGAGSRKLPPRWTRLFLNCFRALEWLDRRWLTPSERTRSLRRFAKAWRRRRRRAERALRRTKKRYRKSLRHERGSAH